MIGRPKAVIMAELNAHRHTLGKPPIKRWRSTRERLTEECQRLRDQVEAKRRKK